MQLYLIYIQLSQIIWLHLQTINNQTVTTYSLVITDNGALITLSNVSAITLLVPSNTSVPFNIGTHIDLVQTGAGKVTVATASNTTKLTVV